MARFRPVSKFKSYTHQALCDYAKGITLALTGNLTFPTPSVSLADQGTLNDSMQFCILAWGPVGQRGSHAQHLALLDARAAVEEMIRNLNDYVDGISAGSQSLIASASMVASAQGNPLGVLPPPANLRSPYSKHTIAGQTRLRWAPVRGAVAYNIYAAAASTDPFVLVGTSSKTLWIGNGTPGRLGYYTVRAVGAEGLGVETSPLAAHSSF